MRVNIIGFFLASELVQPITVSAIRMWSQNNQQVPLRASKMIDSYKPIQNLIKTPKVTGTL